MPAHSLSFPEIEEGSKGDAFVTLKRGVFEAPDMARVMREIFSIICTIISEPNRCTEQLQ